MQALLGATVDLTHTLTALPMIYFDHTRGSGTYKHTLNECQLLHAQN